MAAFAAFMLVVAASCATAVLAPSGTPTSSSASSAALPNGPIEIGGGRHLEMYCRGSGRPTVILDAGLGNTADVWNAISTRVDGFATVCTYNRAGLGGSDPRPEPHGAQAAADDLNALLAATGLGPPYVLVGASYGGLVIQLFARDHPVETAGVILVDAIAPGWDDQLEAILTPAQVAERRAIPNGEPITNEEIRASERAVAGAPSFPPVPLVVLRHGVPFPGGPDWPTDKVEALWTSLQEGLARLSPQSAIILASESGHRIHQQQPDLVTDAIHAVVEPARWPPSGPPPPIAFGSGAPIAALSSSGGVLAFSAEDGIHLAHLDGTGNRLIVANEGMLVGEPSLDDNGGLLAYTRAPRPAAQQTGPQPALQAELWVRDLHGGAARKIAPDAEMPAVSPDGRSVAFTNLGHAYLVQADGTEVRDLGEGGCPVWSPDSMRLTLCSPDDTAFVLRLSDMARVPIPGGPGLNDPTAWSPDGTAIAIFSTRDGDGEIYLIGADGTNERRLTDAPGNQFAQIWTTDGIVVSSSLPDADANDWFIVDPGSGSPSAMPWLHAVPNPISYARSGS
jgi:pimeloyl-ACP methyl ester carboxylesterase